MTHIHKVMVIYKSYIYKSFTKETASACYALYLYANVCQVFVNYMAVYANPNSHMYPCTQEGFSGHMTCIS